MTSRDIVVRYDAVKRAAVESALRKAVRGQGIAAIALAAVWGLVTLLPLVAAAVAGQASATLVLVFGALLLVPLAIGVFGVRQLRRRQVLLYQRQACW